MSMGTAIRLLSGPMGRRLFRPIMRNRATIFMLHRVAAPEQDVHGHTLEQVRNIILALARSGARFVSLRDMLERWRAGETIDPDCVAFTMDDGFADQALLARQVFLPLRCPVTIFLISGFLDGELWPWDDQLAYAFANTTKERADVVLGGQSFALRLDSPSARRAALHRVREHCKQIDNSNLYALVRTIAAALGVRLPSRPPAQHQPMTWEEARALEADGVEFGPHSISHRIFSRLPVEQSRVEINGSWARLQHELRHPSPVFAWPTGRHTDYTEKDVELARAAGMIGCVATDDDYAYAPRGREDALFGVRRFALPEDEVTALRYGSWLERARQFLPV